MKQAINILAIVFTSFALVTITNGAIVRDSDSDKYVTRKEFNNYSLAFTEVLSTLEREGQVKAQEMLKEYEADGRLDSIQIWFSATQSGARSTVVTKEGE